MTDSQPPALRIVPGAPRPPPLSKSQKKKRKSSKPKSTEPVEDVAVPDAASAALIEKAPTEVDVKEGSVAPELVVQPEGTQTPVDESGLKLTPIIDMLNKRLKAIQKKMTRIDLYSTEPPEKLNDDQKRLLKTLPGLEAVRKELEEVKKVITVHESEVAQETAAIQAELVRAEGRRLLDVLAASEAVHRQKMADLLQLLRLRELMSAGHPSVIALGLNESEGLAIYSFIDLLLGEETENREDVIRGFWSGDGEVQGISYARLAEIIQLFINPPQGETSAEEVPEDVFEESSPQGVLDQAKVPVTGLPPALGNAGSFHFMQEDELENQAKEPTLTESEWAETVDIISEQQMEQHAEVEFVDTTVETEVNGNAVVQELISVTTTTEVPDMTPSDGAINWADEEEGGLPSIGSLHAKFGTSGDTTPAPEKLPPASTANGTAVNGHLPHPQDEDGFMQARGRGRGGRGGFRGDRGGFRGRGSDRGGHRGRGGK